MQPKDVKSFASGLLKMEDPFTYAEEQDEPVEAGHVAPAIAVFEAEDLPPRRARAPPRKGKRSAAAARLEDFSSDSSDESDVDPFGEASRYVPGQAVGLPPPRDFARPPPSHYVARPTEHSLIQRFMELQRTKRARGAASSLAQEETDKLFAEFKVFRAMPDDEKEAYLELHEFDHTSARLTRGLAKATMAGLRMSLMSMVSVEDYDIAEHVMNSSELKDTVLSGWECVNIGKYANHAPVKLLSNAGHLADGFFNIAMRALRAVRKAGEERRAITRAEDVAAQSTLHAATKYGSERAPNGADTPPAELRADDEPVVIESI